MKVSTCIDGLCAGMVLQSARNCSENDHECQNCSEAGAKQFFVLEMEMYLYV